MENNNLSKSNTSIRKKDGCLFVLSTTSENYPELRDAILNKHKLKGTYLLRKNEIDNLTQYTIDIINNNFKEIINVCQKEWDYIRDLDEEQSTVNTCSLCGRKIKKNYIIKNKYTQKSIVIGSSCVRDYGLIFEKIKDFEKKEDRLIKINYVESNISKFQKTIRELEKQVNNPRIFLNKELYEEYENLKININKEYTTILNKPNKYKKDFNLDELKSIKLKAVSLIAKIKKQLNYCENTDLGINQNIALWINNNLSDEKIINALRKNNKVTINTASSIEEPCYLQKMIDKIEPLLKDLNIEIIKKSDDNKKLYIKFKIINRVVFEVLTTNLIEIFKNQIFKNEPLKCKDYNILEKSDVSNSSYLEAISYLIPIYEFNNDLKYICYFIEFNILLFKEKGYDKYYILNLKNFINLNKINILNYNSISKDCKIALISEIKKLKSLTKDETKENLLMAGLDENTVNNAIQ